MPAPQYETTVQRARASREQPCISISAEAPSIRLITVEADVIRRAEREIESCEHCHPEDAEIPFDWLLAEVTGKRQPYEFVLSEPARCPNCNHPVTEKTLVDSK